MKLLTFSPSTTILLQGFDFFFFEEITLRDILKLNHLLRQWFYLFIKLLICSLDVAYKSFSRVENRKFELNLLNFPTLDDVRFHVKFFQGSEQELSHFFSFFGIFLR